MGDQDRPLPTPPRSRFGARGEGGSEPLKAERMAQAAAEGRLEEFIGAELPEGEHARTLAMMMLGMSGMLPPDMAGAPPTGAAPAAGAAPAPPPPQAGAAAPVPPQVLAAVEQGDVAGLAALLQEEQARRSGERPAPESPAAPGSAAPQGAPAAPASRAGIDAALVEELVRIGAENGVGVDWLMLRAVRFYVEEHRRTGRL